MLRRTSVIGVTLGAFAVLATSALAAPARLTATDFSSQQFKKKQGGGGNTGGGGVQKQQPKQTKQFKQTNQTKQFKQTNQNKQNFQSKQNFQTKQNFQKNAFPNQGGKNLQKLGGQKFVQPGLKLKLGPGKIGPALKPVNFQGIKLANNKIAPIWKGPKKLWWGGKWKTFVPLAVLGAFAIGGTYYYADGYLSLSRNYCEGFTPDGCRLNWQRVDFEDGDSDWQCVQFCPRPGAPPPARTMALVAPPPIQQGSTCEMSIFSEPGFGGVNATSNGEQPHLSELGWQNQVASIKIASGTWDFFSGEEFTGEVMRYGPGEYPDLGPEWSRKAASFMCAQP